MASIRTTLEQNLRAKLTKQDLVNDLLRELKEIIATVAA